MQDNEQQKEIVTVAEMARTVGLSRSRFYSLIDDGVMPAPSRNTQTGRPYYTREQQDQCVQVRRRNCGVNGKPILFYAQSPRMQQPRSPKRTAKPSESKSAASAPTDPVYEGLKCGLAQLGLAEVSDVTIRSALAECCPDGYGDADPASLLMTVFRCLKRRNTQDNVK